MKTNAKKKAKKPVESTQQIHIRLKQSVVNTLDSYCGGHGITRNQYIIEAVLRRLNSDLKK